MNFRKGYKYQLAEQEIFHTPIMPPENIHTEFISLFTDGKLVINSGYAWDGPSGLTIDSSSGMRPSLGHDALFQLLRMGLLDPYWLDPVNSYLYDCLLEDKMWKWRARLWYRAVDQFGDFAADPANAKKIYEAPAIQIAPDQGCQ